MLRPNCQRKGCTRIRPDLGLLLNRRKVPQFEGREFCSDRCLELQVESELSERWENARRRTPPRLPRPKLGAILLQSGTITQLQLERAIALQKEEGRGRIGEWLQQLGCLSERQITQALSRQYGLPMINLRESDPPSEAARLVPGRIARTFSSLPVGYDDERETIQLAITPPFGYLTQDVLRRMTGRTLSLFIADESQIRKLLELWYAPSVPGDGEEITFQDLEDVLSIARATISFAGDNKATNLRIELIEDCLWTRIDFPGSSLHRVCQYAPAVGPGRRQTEAVAASGAGILA